MCEGSDFCELHSHVGEEQCLHQPRGPQRVDDHGPAVRLLPDQAERRGPEEVVLGAGGVVHEHVEGLGSLEPVHALSDVHPQAPVGSKTKVPLGNVNDGAAHLGDVDALDLGVVPLPIGRHGARTEPDHRDPFRPQGSHRDDDLPHDLRPCNKLVRIPDVAGNHHPLQLLFRHCLQVASLGIGQRADHPAHIHLAADCAVEPSCCPDKVAVVTILLNLQSHVCSRQVGWHRIWPSLPQANPSVGAVKEEYQGEATGMHGGGNSLGDG
mmetsp:Transcript_102698/g.306760  ORF Transcript_102698/g.306760 Transcript_102698/m.306760 type:complete len:267 (+) Transcript_102698:343-1143(+)